MTAALPVLAEQSRQLATLDQLASIPEEDIWLAKQKSAQTRRDGLPKAAPSRQA
jgi:hypothetical protein